MALTKKAKFENDSAEQTAAVLDQPDTPAAETVAEAAADVAATTAIATASATSTAVARPAEKLPTALTHLKDTFTVEYDTFPRLLGASGSIEDGDNRDLGEWVKLRLVSWQNQWDIVPGSQDEEAKAHLRYSSDGVTIDATGESVNEYLAKLQNDLGYPKASVKQRVVLVGLLTESHKKSPLIGETVQVSLSPQARKTFERYCFSRTIKAQMGTQSLDGAENILITAVKKTAGTNKYTLLDVTAA